MKEPVVCDICGRRPDEAGKFWRMSGIDPGLRQLDGSLCLSCNKSVVEVIARREPDIFQEIVREAEFGHEGAPS